MNWLKRLRLFPRSLRQLVLLAFLLVLLPLLVLAYQAYQGLNNLSSQAASINNTTLADARRSEAMTNVALEMERSYRQFCVLRDNALEKLYHNQRQQYAKMLEAHASVLPDIRYYQTLRELLDDLSEISCEQSEPEPKAISTLEKFSQSNAEMMLMTRDIMFSRGAQLQKAISERGQFFGWQALLLFLLSLVLVILFTRMIIGPVNGIEHMINRLGEGHLLDQNTTIKGPRELRSLAQRIVWLSDRLTWLESQRHEFLRHISHELKTPLASMREGTELLADEVAGSLTADQKEVVAILDNSSKHLQQLIEQLLDYNRKLSENAGEKVNVSLKEMIESVIIAHSLPARAKGMKTQYQLDITHCIAESSLLMRVLDNLYSNAVHYGEEFGNIWIICHKSARHIQIDVANTGESIPESEQKMLFEPFFQGRVQRKGAVKGSGLGLSIARDCIRRMKGELKIVNVDYAAVCFRIELPLVAENEK